PPARVRGSGSHPPATAGSIRATGSGSLPLWSSATRSRGRAPRPGASDRGSFVGGSLLAMEQTPIVELGFSEAYEIVTARCAITDLPPVDSLENEDWGRDYLLSRFLELPRAALAAAGLCISLPPGEVEGGPDVGSSNEKTA